MTDDSEEIFRRAADSYPLKTDNADWEAVLRKMNDDNHGAAGEMMQSAKKRNYRPLLLLLLLIPFAVIEYKYSGFSNLLNKKGQRQTASGSVVSTKPVDAAERQLTPQNKKNVPGPVETNQFNPPIQGTGKTDPAQATPAVAKQKDNTNNAPIAITSVTQATSLISESDKINPATLKHAASQRGNNGVFVNNDIQEKTNVSHHKASFAAKQKTKVNIKSEAATGDEAEHNIVSTEKNIAVVTEPARKKDLADADNAITKKENIKEKKSATPIIKTPDSAAIPVKEITKTTTKAADKDKKKNSSPQKHFYAGLIAGPDFSTIKLQSVKKTGFNVGFVAGYRINNKFSIETGLLKDKKYYSSKGEYFSTKKLDMPPDASIEYVAGDCKMLELPLNIYYTFSKRKTSTWFAAAGISSYFMSKETYTFDVKRYGYSYPYAADYKTHDNQFAAVINFSAGYTHKIGKIGDLRIEPYIKIPVSKVGTGNLPIQSAGIMVGFTRNLF